MFIYIAALHSNGYKHTKRYENLNDHEKGIINQLPNMLESYHYIHKDTFVNAIRERGDKVFLDSGAFSAWTLGTKIDLTEYCDYIKRNIDIIRFDNGVMMASVLDGIGDPQETYENQLKMEAQGVKPLPCFHFGEDERYLDWYVENYEYITIGGMVGKPVPTLLKWLDRIWHNHLTNKDGTPKIKVHAFGVTSIAIMEKYPWWSCDSSSWIQSAAFGSVITPAHGPLSVSEKSPSRHTAGQHVDNLTTIEQSQILKMFELQGFTYDRLSQVYESRAVYNLWAFCEINKTINRDNPNQFQSIIQELF